MFLITLCMSETDGLTVKVKETNLALEPSHGGIIF